MIKVAIRRNKDNEIVVEFGFLELNLTVVFFVVYFVDALEELFIIREKGQEFTTGLIALIV
jgi:hypothetical protein